MQLSTTLKLLWLAAAAQANSSSSPSKCGPPQHHGNDFVPDHILRVTLANVSVGCQTRQSVLVNGTLPGPELRLKAGKTNWIRVYNDMEEYNTTIHWHGLSQRTAIFSDGTPSASQWPIAPLHYFDYEVHPLHDHAGTYFYHSHVGFQAVTAAGALIVEDNGKPPYHYDEERIVLLSDYFKETDATIESGLVATPFKWSGETNAVLINGVGVSKGETAGNGNCKLPVIDVEPGKTYRFRFIGGTALSMVQLSIVDHQNFTIVAADAQYTKPHTESFMQLSSGQRFDVIFKAKSIAELAGKTDHLIQFETKDRPVVYRGYGVLRYSSGKPSITTAPSTPPLSLSKAPYSWNEYSLQPLKPNNFPSASEVTRRITIHARQFLTDTAIWRLNGDQWNETSPQYVYPGNVPYLVKIYEEGQAAIPDYDAALQNNGWDPTTYAWPAKIGEVLEIVWVNTGRLIAKSAPQHRSKVLKQVNHAGSFVNDDGAVDYHPFHAHSGHFYDIGSGNGTYDPVANEKKLKNYHPVRRDTTNLYRYETGTTAGTNAGWLWMIHCHILQHMLMGMQTVWTFGEASDILKIPEEYVSGYLIYGGNAQGNATHAPMVVHQFSN
ncbi:L-ascorbate oxidase [Acrodontium crateriforme]|uniref:L-ascorbate oxidase n=1 Tax=Acrodontium crateriforme TaxID=150365 RepID=A0AAQ3R3W3_9PEZI|nr:L-ascorbate oxidase [Acrodontium crateriforme]